MAYCSAVALEWFLCCILSLRVITMELHLETPIKGEARFITLCAWLTPGCCGSLFMRYQLALVLPHTTTPVLIFLHVSAVVSLEDTEPVCFWGGCNGVSPKRYTVWQGKGCTQDMGCRSTFCWAEPAPKPITSMLVGLGQCCQLGIARWGERHGCKPNGCKNENAGHTKQLLSSQKTCVPGCYVNLERL